MNQTFNWTYACRIANPPAVIFDTARKMNRLWNELVAMHNRLPYQLLKRAAETEWKLASSAKNGTQAQCLERANRIKAAAAEVMMASYKGFNTEAYSAIRTGIKAQYEAAKQAEGEESASLRRIAKEARSQIFQLPSLDIPFTEKVNEYVQTRGNELGLPVWCKWYVGDNFKLALEAYAKRQRNAPDFKRGLDSVHIENRTDSGKGWPSEAIFGERKAVSLKVLPRVNMRASGHLARGYFQVGGEQVPIEVIMHRPFPEGAIVKRFSLLGKYEAAENKWEWQVMFTLSCPSPSVAYPVTSTAISIDAGWRAERTNAMNESGIRIMTIFDGTSAQEIVLPYDLSNKRERRHHAENSNRPPIDIREVWRIQSERDSRLEQCKSELRTETKDGWPDEAVRMMRGITKMRAGGLMRIRHKLTDASLVSPAIESWLEYDRPAWIQQRHIQRRWLATRDEFYRVLAAELTDQADVVVWEGDLSLKQMAEESGKKKNRRKAKHEDSGEWDARSVDERILEASMRWRHTAGLYKLRLWIKEEVAQKRRELIDEAAAYSSQVCYHCGASITPSASLIVMCANGHKHDQDENTCRYFWGRLADEVRAAAVPMASVGHSQIRRLFRPLND